MIGYGPSIEILGRGTLTAGMVRADVDKVLAACADWTGEREIMRVTGLGKGRVMAALARAGDRLDRMAQSRNTCFQRWVWKRTAAADQAIENAAQGR